MTKRVLGIALVVLIEIQFQPLVGASAWQFEAPKIFEQSVTRDLRLSEGGEIELETGELFEDDGPASGHSYEKPENRETVTPQTWIKKELIIPNPQAVAAYVVVLSEEPFEALINGAPQSFGENQSGRKLYKTYAVEPKLLKAGCNEIILRTSGRVSIARDDEFALGSRVRTKHPNRSAKSIDVELSSRNPLESPKLRSVRVEATPVCPGDWTARIRVQEEHNEQIVRTAIPFEYEPLDHPRLKKLREEYKLDEVVRGAGSELELMLRLAQWACNYWDWPNHISEYYPSWDALEVLKPHRDGKPTGGFCQQFNLVFLQACESFGFPGRAISISQGHWQERYPGGGHEIVELWSNEWKKWVYVDGALAWYIVDPKAGVPLSIWELRQRQLPTLHGEPAQPMQIIDAERTRNRQFVWQGLGGPKPLNWYLELRMIPRSNFLQEKSPLPLNQGTEEWSWTGHYVWTDAEVPAGLLFGHRVSRHTDFEWTLNQAHHVLEPAKKPGTFRVHLDTETPSFETFLAEIDGGEKKPVSSGFIGTLHAGKNLLRVRPRNTSGREGILSWLGLDYSE